MSEFQEIANFITMFDALPEYVRAYAETHNKHVHPSEVAPLDAPSSAAIHHQVNDCLTYGISYKVQTPRTQGLINWLAAYEAA